VERSTTRFEAFSDGVFAFAITLLVLDLSVGGARGDTTPDLVRALAGHWPKFLSFLLSFATILILWMNHHALFDWVVRANGPLMVANGVVLLLVVLVPFTTALLGDHLDGPAANAAAVVYTAVLTLVAVAFRWVWAVVTGDRATLAPGLPDAEVRLTNRYLLFGFLAQLAAVALALWSAKAAVALTLALAAFWLGNAYRRHRAAPEPA
jgi:uncharacterized membrane protein